MLFRSVFHIGYCEHVSIQQPQRPSDFKRIAASNLPAGVLDAAEYFGSSRTVCRRRGSVGIGIQASSELF